MSDVYKRLAMKLDQLPQGYPATENGIELKILRKVFSSEDAEMALKLRPIPETTEAIAERLGTPVETMRITLDAMAKKGQIASHTRKGEQVYAFIPFFPGLWEYQVLLADPDKDKEILELCEEYFSFAMKKLGGYEPGVLRTVPINVHIESGSQVQRYEDVRKIVEQAQSFLVQDCQCRKEQKILGHGCDHTIENCLNFSTEENAYDYFNLSGRIISKEEAVKILEKAEEEGLVHNVVYNTRQGHMAICNCCPCCCAALRGVKKFEAPYLIARSNFVAVIDQDTCTNCGVCADERCPMDAIIEDDDEYKVLPHACIGCGVCTLTCPTESITLFKRSDSVQNKPADNMKDWSIKRAASRGIELKFE